MFDSNFQLAQKVRQKITLASGTSKKNLKAHRDIFDVHNIKILKKSIFGPDTRSNGLGRTKVIVQNLYNLDNIYFCSVECH